MSKALRYREEKSTGEKKSSMSLEPLDDLNRIGRGVNKRWIYKDSLQWELAHYYLQKNSVQDINHLFRPSGRIEKRTDTVSLIVMVDWIADSVYRYKECLTEKLASSFDSSYQEELKGFRGYLKAVRSLVVAHPLGTSKHKDLGLDGDIICIDLRMYPPTLFGARNENARRFGVDGIRPYEYKRDDDIYLYVYSKSSNAQFFEFLIVDLFDVLHVARTYIDQLYELDKHLSGLRKRDYAAK